MSSVRTVVKRAMYTSLVRYGNVRVRFEMKQSSADPNVGGFGEERLGLGQDEFSDRLIVDVLLNGVEYVDSSFLCGHRSQTSDRC